MPPQYENAKIYKLVSNKTADVYIGSCLIKLHRRLYSHKAPSNECVSKKMFKNDAIITIALVEAMPECKSKAEMNARELYYITTMDCININKPFITDVRQVGGNKAEWKKEYRKKHAEESKAYRAKNAEEIREQQKEYYKSHAEEKKAYNKEYRTNNAEAINKQRRERYAKKKVERLSTQTVVGEVSS